MSTLSGLTVAQHALDGVTAVQLFAKTDLSDPKTIENAYRAIKNTSATDTAYIGPTNTVTAVTGHAVGPGETLVLVGYGRGGGACYNGDVWAIAAATKTPTVTVISF